jgi:hypothetical protein
MKKRLIIFVIGLVVIFAAGGVVYYYKFYNTAPPQPVANENQNENQNQNVPVGVITNFEECVAAGNPVMESYPRQCRANGQNFVENIGNELEKTDLIKIDSPRPNTVVTSPLGVTGQARGTWYFEAVFPIKLLDADGNVLVQIPAQAQGDWMTESFVPFKATLEFTAPTTDTGTLVLEKDNPSGLPEHADSLIVPVKFR